jgi:hypothetical protein
MLEDMAEQRHRQYLVDNAEIARGDRPPRSPRIFVATPRMSTGGYDPEAARLRGQAQRDAEYAIYDDRQASRQGRR